MSMQNKLIKTIVCASTGLLATLAISTATAEVEEQAKRIHDRIAGVPPTATELTAMVNAMNAAAEDKGRAAALAVPLNNKNFYNVTLKNMYTPWTNEAQTVFAPLNDFTATMIGIIRDELDFRTVLYDDIIYTGIDAADSLPPYSDDNNDHYAALESQGIDLSDSDKLAMSVQSQVTSLPAGATSGVLTTRAAGKAFFVGGTNRAMFRFTTLNFLCNDMEQLKDTTRPTDRIRQDVTRSPGGDSRIFMNACMGCHSGMDPMAQAYAYYEWSGVEGTEDGRIEFTNGTVQPKYHINANNFPYGYVTPDSHWTNYWREGPNGWVGWDATLPGEGDTASSMNQELAHSDAFAQCQVKKVFSTICLRDPITADDLTEMESLVTRFTGTHNYNLKQVFADTAEYCMGE
ncbi:hypothetical protein A9Q81_26845 [Gammaproteobacteria bacterium 42_54_T18]|nr:hypothetical protein A9Q81_26845 [Gammaproteobacteria bacterium 42_54_T18]